MNSSKDTSFSASVYLYPLGMVLLIWIMYWIEQRFGFRLHDWGIRPRSWKGLRGVFFAPLLHGGVMHLFSNSVPLLVLSMALFYFYKNLAFRVLVFGGILTGLLTWLIGRTGSNHIGASGVVYLLASFLFFKGIWSKNRQLIALSLVVAFLYGSLVWGVLPGKPNISWEGHLSGFFSGVVFALIYRKYQPDVIEYQPIKQKMSRREKEFLRHFDEQGNFIPTSEWRNREEENKRTQTRDDVEIVYSYCEWSQPPSQGKKNEKK